MRVAELDALPEKQVAKLLAACCGAPRWVDGMLRRRPFGTRAVLLADAEAVWNALPVADRLEAVAHHPRIGERQLEESPSAVSAAWSRGEQAAAAASDATVRAELACEQAAYEQRFGRIFIVCATGRSAGEVLAEVRRRSHNDAATEEQVVSEELRKITRIRLEKLVPPEDQVTR